MVGRIIPFISLEKNRSAETHKHHFAYPNYSDTHTHTMASFNDATLFDVFNMLMERTTKLEKTIDRAMIHTQMNTIGSLDISFFGLPYEVYVHEPLDKIYLGLDQYNAFYIETDVEFPVDSLLKQIADGVFDDALGTGKEIIKQDIRDEIAGEKCDVLITECCDLPSVHSKRRRLREHVIDLIVQKYVTSIQNDDSLAQIHYDPINYMTSFFVFLKDSSTRTRFSFPEELTRHVIRVTKCIDPAEKIKRLTICPLTKADASTMMASHHTLEKEGTIIYNSSRFPRDIDRLTTKLKDHLFWRTTSPFVRASLRPDYR